MATRRQEQKEHKKQGLLQAANDLFAEKGVNKTSIDNIVERAQVAKGTFYLYFHNKEEIQQALILKITTRVLNEAYDTVAGHTSGNITEDLISFLDCIIEHFKQDKRSMKLIERNLSWPMVAQKLYEGNDPLWQKLLSVLRKSPAATGLSDDELFKRIFVMVEMCGSVCYSSIIEEKPDTIDHMKPILYDIIRKSLS